MASTLYESIFQKGETQGKAEVCAETVIRLLTRWMGTLDAALREQLRHVPDLETLKPWYDEALFLNDAAAAERLAKKIQKSLPA